MPLPDSKDSIALKGIENALDASDILDHAFDAFTKAYGIDATERRMMLDAIDVGAINKKIAADLKVQLTRVARPVCLHKLY